MTHGITKETVRSTVGTLNDRLERLGWVRRYEVEFGSNPNGVKHVLQTRLPHLQHPTDQHPFATLSKLHQYLLAMGQVLNDAVAERERQRAIVQGGAIAALDPHRVVDIPFDPDARNVRRQGEELQHRTLREALQEEEDHRTRPAGADQ